MDKNTDSYNILLLGDLHYDGPAYHVREPENEVQKRGRLRNFAMWDGKSQDLLKEAASRVDDSFPWVVQLGDLSQGDGDDVELQSAMLRDAIATVKGNFPGKKFLPVIGNHDLRLLDAFPRWDEYDENGCCTQKAGCEYRPIRNAVIPHVQAETGLETAPAAVDYVMHLGDDLYIFIDPFYPGGATEFIRQALADTPDSRRVFVVSHLALFPCEPATKWAMWTIPDCAAVAEMLAPRRAVILSGHTHYNHLIRYRHPRGVINQLVLSSMSTHWRARPLELTTGNYADFAKLMFPYLEGRPREIFPDENYLDHRTWRCIADGKPSSATGYAVMRVTPDSVTAEIYDGGATPAMKLPLD